MKVVLENDPSRSSTKTITPLSTRLGAPDNREHTGQRQHMA